MRIAAGVETGRPMAMALAIATLVDDNSPAAPVTAAAARCPRCWPPPGAPARPQTPDQASLYASWSSHPKEKPGGVKSPSLVPGPAIIHCWCSAVESCEGERIKKGEEVQRRAFGGGIRDAKGPDQGGYPCFQAWRQMHPLSGELEEGGARAWYVVRERAAVVVVVVVVVVVPAGVSPYLDVCCWRAGTGNSVAGIDAYMTCWRRLS
ncbi:hypothetical protein J3F83DRAFT_720126 [Trichoderma novae-zelandiae]